MVRKRGGWGVANQRHDAAFIVGAVIGGVAAGAYALFEAPQAGTETRAQLAERGDALAERLAQTTAEVDGRVRRWLARAEEQTAPLMGRVTRRPMGSTAATTALGSVVDTEPFITLPDPLEPDPVLTEPEPTAGANADVVVDVPRLTDPDR